MKTIFLTVSAGQEVQNFLLGDFYLLIKNRPDLRLVVFVPEKHVKRYRTHFSHGRCFIEPIPPIQFDRRSKEVFRIICFGCIPTITIRSRNLFAYYNGGSWAGLLCKQFFWLLGHFRVWRALMRLVEFFLFRDDKFWRPYFDKYKPDVVLGAGQIAEEDITMVKFAKRRGVPTVGMMRSWDNFTSKGFLRVFPDVLLVQNISMVKEAWELNSFPESRVRVVGCPRWDHYLDSAWHMTKEEFAVKFGLDPTKRWVTYFGGGLILGLFNIPESGDHVVMINKAIAKGELKDACTIIRPHPSFSQYLSDEARKSPVLAFGKGWEIEFDILEYLLNLVRLSDVTLNLGSTMSLEAAIFDKPIILVGFTGYSDDSKLPWHRRPVVALDNTLHYQVVEKTGGVWRVNNEKELIEAVKTYLENPKLHREGRERIRKELVGPVGGNGQKILGILLEQIKV